MARSISLSDSKARCWAINTPIQQLGHLFGHWVCEEVISRATAPVLDCKVEELCNHVNKFRAKVLVFLTLLAAWTMQRRTVLTTIGVGITTSLAGCGTDTDYEDGGNGGSSGSDDSGGLEILEHELVREDPGTSYETVSVKGRAKNTGNSRLGYAEVKARFYNEAGDQLDTSLDNTNDLDAGATWSFEIQYFAMGEDARAVASYEVGPGDSF